MQEKLESIIKFFPLIFILLTTLGYVHLQTYYYFFDIEILNYIDITEIILLFFNKSILIIVGILIVNAVSYILDNKINNEANNKKESSTKKRNFILNNLGVIIIIFLLIYIVIVLISGKYISLIYPIGYLICGIIYLVLEKHFFKILFLNHTPFFFFSISTSIVVLLLINLSTITNSIEKGYNVRNNNLIIKQVCFSYNNKIIKTSKEIVYIGETKKNLFLFDLKQNETIIYKMENIDNFRMKAE